ncbi:MAG: hypothetical protein K0U93_05550, partial [Gammaproteobacteria bacterium]|nr:hypothetical protein [Gammaproteobacteria bacterium]
AATLGFEAWVNILTWLALIGGGLAIIRRDRRWTVAGGLFLCFAVAHSLTVLDVMFYYIKLPFLIFFSACLLDRLPAYLALIRSRAAARSIATAAAAIIFASSAALNAFILL